MGADILVFKEWLQELRGEKGKLKMMLYFGANTDSQTNTCRCSLKDLREWLGQASKTANKKNIERLEQLQKQSYISYTPTGNTYNIKVNVDNKNIIPGIKKQWLEELRGANRDKAYKKIDVNINADWLQAFYLFVNIHTGRIRGLTTQKEIGNILDISTPTVCGALKLLNLCNFDNISCKGITDKGRINFKTKNEEGIYIVYEQVYNKGTHIDYIDYRDSAY